MVRDAAVVDQMTLIISGSEPSAFRRATLFRIVPLYLENRPPMRIFPSGWRATAVTLLSGPELLKLKVLSIAPGVKR